MRSFLAIATLTFLLGGCPGGDDDDDAVALADAPDRYGQVYCERLLECSALGVTLLSQTTCELAVWTYRNDGLARLDTWVADQSVSYDGAAMAGCLADVADLACPELSTATLADLGRCGDAIRGQLAGGGACEDTLQCSPGLYCETATTCPGTCQPRIAAGGSCATDDSCAARLDCAGGTCVAFGQAGAPCGASGMTTCALGFQCDTTGGTPGTCQPVTFAAADGAACNPGGGALCGAGLVCAMVNVTPATYQCQAPAVAGGACRRAVPSACPVGQVCVVATNVVDGTCTAQGTAGQPCLSGGSVMFGCAAGLFCDMASNTCVVRVDNGEACTVDGQCAGACEAGVCDDPLACD